MPKQVVIISWNGSWVSYQIKHKEREREVILQVWTMPLNKALPFNMFVDVCYHVSKSLSSSLKILMFSDMIYNSEIWLILL